MNIAFLVALLSQLAGSAPGTVARAGEAGVRAADAAYVKAWIDNDERAVLETLAPDAVLMPAGHYPLKSVADIRGFWWPQDGSTTRILSFARTIDELTVVGDMAMVQGTDSVTFEYDKGATHLKQKSDSMTLAIYRLQPSGDWRISRMMWANRSR